jgi:hypothetical protein
MVPSVTTTVDSVPATIRAAHAAYSDHIANRLDGKLEDRDPNAHEAMIIHHPAPKAELPADRAEVILVGTITGIQSFPSSNHSALYTESTVQIEHIFGQISSQALQPGQSIAVIHDGGALRLPTGRVIRQVVRGSGNELQQGARYVFFLVYLPKLAAYGCTKAWLLSQRVAIAVSEDDLVRVASNRSTYNKVSELILFMALQNLRPSWNTAAPH